MQKTIDRTNRAIRVTWIGLLWNIFLTLFKLFAGVIGKSNALIADAFHSLSDFITDIAIIIGLNLAKKPVDETHNYGHGKFETLSTIIISISLFFVSIAILGNGIIQISKAIQGQILHQPGWIAFIAASGSIIVKEILYQYTIRAGTKINSQALIANAWHHRSDALSSLAATFGIAGAILLGEQWRILDPIAAIVVSFFIFRVAVTVFKRSINELLEASLSEELKSKILNIVKTVPGAADPHNLKTRKIGNSIALDMHIKVKPSLSIVEAHDISTSVEKKLKESFGNDTFISIHIEPDNLE
jgi:cation diffusion facilitator family transporter